MSDVMLDAAKVQRLIEEKGLKRKWVLEQLGLKRTAGHYLLNKGLLPEDAKERKALLSKLAHLVGAEVPQILLHLEARTA